MSKPEEKQTENQRARVQVENLPQAEKELKDGEAAKVKGGGGPAGGVNRTIGEEIPQTVR